MDRLSLLNALDHAIAQAGKHELDLALHEPDYYHDIPAQKRRLVAEKAGLLRDTVRSLQMPDYDDPLIADAHLLYYHPSHVGLACALITNQSNRHPNRNLLLDGSTRLHIIDLAAGNLAMQFGAAIRIGQALELGQRITAVRITNIDPSAAMLEAGQDAWSEFVQAVNSDSKLAPLADACAMIQTEYLSEPWNIRGQMPDAECWISMMHGLYGNNYDSISDELSHLHDVTNPTTVFVTCFGTRTQMNRVNDAIRATPFNHPPYERQTQFIRTNGLSELPLPWDNDPWRPEDHHRIEVDDVCHHYGVGPDNRHVFWRVPNTAALSWTRT